MTTTTHPGGNFAAGATTTNDEERTMPAICKNASTVFEKMGRGLVLSQNSQGNYWLFDAGDVSCRVSVDAAERLIVAGKIVRDYKNTDCFGVNWVPAPATVTN